jgi:hypothetical protein
MHDILDPIEPNCRTERAEPRAKKSSTVMDFGWNILPSTDTELPTRAKDLILNVDPRAV